jgi:hypothetical protein
MSHENWRSTVPAMELLVAHLLSIRHKLRNREIIACLVIAQLKPTPRERIPAQVLMDALQISERSYLSNLLSALARHGLLEYESGTFGEPGYLFWRVGPPPSRIAPKLQPNRPG